MLHATTTSRTGVSFVPKVGVAPATTTMMLPAARQQRVAKRLPVPHPAHGGGYYMPYGTVEDLRSPSGLGIINETDAWLTGRPYGLPGTASIKLTRRANGVNYASQMLGNDQGDPVIVGNEVRYPYPYIVGGGLGEDASLTVTALQQIATAQADQRASLKRIAFWQTLLGATTMAVFVGTVIIGAVQYSRGR